MARPWVTVEAARRTAATKYSRSFGEWSVGRGTALMDVPLHPPTESGALADQAAAIAWVTSWRNAGLDDSVVWTTRRWASVGSQEIPDRLRLEGAAAIAGFARKGSQWLQIRSRADALLTQFAPGPAARTGVPDDPVAGESTSDRGNRVADAVQRSSRALSDLADIDFERLLSVLLWLEANPDSGLYIRQLPVRGVDTKWISMHRVLVERLFAAVTGHDSLGLALPPAQVRIRFLDPEYAPGGLVDVAVPITELADLPIQPRTVFVFENLESVVAMPPVPGAVVIHGSGYAVGRLSGIPWVSDGHVVYWGDLDSHGFGILNRVRSSCSDVSVVLMDLETLRAHRDLWVEEPSPNSGVFGYLLPDELVVVAELQRLGNVRLEQERIGWAYALTQLLQSAQKAR
ncbi:hypothetical protein IWX64_002294 [Arthrobacter sp. CAN_A212]|uniref:Wadjet anti-phage system protein JetD domain-containing protein n=1 Tax=Arthrobacter sp. CAN_A212 TaxID=2787719 RepID=UPI0018CBA5F9